MPIEYWQDFLDGLTDSIIVDECNDRPSSLDHDHDQLVRKFVSLSSRSKPGHIADYLKLMKTKRRGKVHEKAVKHKSLGNDYFKKKLYSSAILEYTKSIRHGAPESSDLAVGFANRSAAFYYQQQYESCLSDINNAIEAGYPEEIKYKLLNRKANCFFKLGYSDRLAQAVENAELCLDRTDGLTTEKKDSMKRELQDLLVKSDVICDRRNITPTTDIDLDFGKNTSLPQASAAIELSYDPQKGRHLKAKKNLKAGDTLIVEDPFAAVLLPDNALSHCHHCFEVIEASIPCDECSEVLYCSKDCKLGAWTQYHRLECSYLQICHAIGIAHLGLRIVLVAGLATIKDFQENYAEIKKSNHIAGVDKTGCYDLGYLAVYDLMPHMDEMNEADLMSYAATAYLLLLILEDGGYFSSTDNLHCLLNKTALTESTCDKNTSLLSDDLRTTVGAYLLRHICQLVCNAHAITELQVSSDHENLVDSTSQVRIATAIYPTASLMNHSCDPTIISSFIKNKLVVKAVKDVKPGEEIFNCYGPHFRRMSFRERQDVLLDQYFFKCVCSACESTTKEDNIFSACLCKHCAGPLGTPCPQMTCLHCGAVTDGQEEIMQVLDSFQLFQSGIKAMRGGNVNGAKQLLEDCLRLREGCMYKHHRELAEVQDALAQCYCMQGKFSLAVPLLEKSTSTAEQQYGPSSIELANELQKFSEVLVHAGRKQDSLRTAQRALSILHLNYGSKHRLSVEVQRFVNDLKA